MTQGILYLFCGMGAAERLVVSVNTLRQHYSGDVSIFTTTDEERQLVEDMSQLQVKSVPIPRIGDRHRQYVTKSAMPKWSPYDVNVYLDADTIVCKPLDKLFEEAAKGMFVTEFCNWISTGRRMTGRILSAAHKAEADNQGDYLSGYIEALCQEQLREKATSSAEYPAINTGVLGWKKGHPGMALWYAVTMAIGHRFIADETAMQLVLPNIGAEIVSHAYNASPMHTEVDHSEVAIWHFHGRKHVKKEPGRSLWAPELHRAMTEKVARINRWAGRHDKTVRAYLKELK